MVFGFNLLGKSKKKQEPADIPSFGIAADVSNAAKEKEDEDEESEDLAVAKATNEEEEEPDVEEESEEAELTRESTQLPIIIFAVSHGSRMRCIFNRIRRLLNIDFNGIDAPGNAVRFKNCAILRINFIYDKSSNSYTIDVDLIYNGEIADARAGEDTDKEQPSIDRKYYTKDNVINDSDGLVKFPIITQKTDTRFFDMMGLGGFQDNPLGGQNVTIYFQRHGQARHNVKIANNKMSSLWKGYAHNHRIYTDALLTKTGEKQSYNASNILKIEIEHSLYTTPPNIIYAASKLRRTQQTLMYTIYNIKINKGNLQDIDEPKIIYVIPCIHELSKVGSYDNEYDCDTTNSGKYVAIENRAYKERPTSGKQPEYIRVLNERFNMNITVNWKYYDNFNTTCNKTSGIAQMIKVYQEVYNLPVTISGGNKKRRTNKRRTSKRRTHKRRTHKRRTHKRRTHKRKSNKRHHKRTRR